MSHIFNEQEHDQHQGGPQSSSEKPQQEQGKQPEDKPHTVNENPTQPQGMTPHEEDVPRTETPVSGESRPVERPKAPARPGARGTAAMDPKTRQEVARKGGLAVSRNKQHMAEIGRKGGQSVSKNREHMAQIGRKGGAASRGHR